MPFVLICEICCTTLPVSWWVCSILCAVVTVAVGFDTSYTVSQSMHSCGMFVRNMLLENNCPCEEQSVIFCRYMSSWIEKRHWHYSVYQKENLKSIIVLVWWFILSQKCTNLSVWKYCSCFHHATVKCGIETFFGPVIFMRGSGVVSHLYYCSQKRDLQVSYVRKLIAPLVTFMFILVAVFIISSY